MQKKIINFVIALFITADAVAQQSVYTVTTNDHSLPVKETSFTVAIVPEKTGTAFRLFVQNTERKRIELKISHQDIGLLVDTSFTEEQFNCRYNFEQAEDGYYQVIIVNGKERVIRDFEINTITRRNVVIR
jgi:outer membrane lipoprotein-sorting protein